MPTHTYTVRSCQEIIDSLSIDHTLREGKKKKKKQHLRSSFFLLILRLLVSDDQNRSNGGRKYIFMSLEAILFRCLSSLPLANRKEKTQYSTRFLSLEEEIDIDSV